MSYPIPEDLKPTHLQCVEDQCSLDFDNSVVLKLILRIAKAEHDLAVAHEALWLACKDAWDNSGLPDPNWPAVYLVRAARKLDSAQQHTEKADQEAAQS